VVSPFLPDEAKLRSVREAIPAVSAGIYVNIAEAGPLPAETAAAMAEIADHELRFGRGHLADIEDAEGRRDEARAALAAVLAADVGSVALTRGSRDALQIALESIPWNAGDELVTVPDAGRDLEAAGRLLASRGVRVVPVAAGVVASAVAGERVRAVALPHVDAIGRRLPIERLARAVKAARPDVGLIVDGRLAVGSVPVVVDELGVDAYAVAGDAWLLGPAGTGGLWVAGADDAVGLERGDVPVRSAVGLARSIGWLSMFVGLDWVLGRPAALATRLLDRLARIDGLRLLTPGDAAERAAIVAFELPRWPAEEAVAELGRRVFAIAGVLPGRDAVRLSVACFNEPSELDRLAEAISVLAAHTPESLPRRTALTIVG
jgi:selenocysteine lyase/cysteine desulfurase